MRGETQTKAEEVLKRKINENITYEDVWDTCTGQKEFHSIRYFYQWKKKEWKQFLTQKN